MAILDRTISEESRDRFLTYALSVVSGRALPDVRDGLKPVQRRILYAMLNDLSLKPENSFKKSATIIGAVLGRYHPHGDVACYEALVRMAQSFSLRYPLIDGQGNFGSIDGDPPAAFRYTEAKLLALAIEVLGEIYEETVPWTDNFDASFKEPVVLPSRVPNLLINGSSGIAVGMATNIPPHNLRDTVHALLELLDNPKVDDDVLIQAIKAPDFPTGCLILNSRKELSDLYKTGQGAVRMRASWREEQAEKKSKRQIIIDSIPYAVNKSTIVEKIADFVMSKKLPQIHDVRDESTDKVRIVLELVPEAKAEVAMAFLFKNTALESNFNVNFTALIPDGHGVGIPKQLNLKQMLQAFLDFREQVVQRRLQFERKNLLERIHILEGFRIIFDALDEAIKIVRKSEGRSDAADKLMKRFKLSELQSFAIVDLRIYQLSKTNIDEIIAELKAKMKRLKEIEEILGNRKKVLSLVKSDLKSVQERFADNRLCRVVTKDFELDVNEADYLVKEDVYALITEGGWIKRIRQNNELSSTRLREGDAILAAHAATTLDSIILVTNLGSIYRLPVSEFPASGGYGEPVQKLLKFKDNEQVVGSYVCSAATDSPAGDFLREGSRLIAISARGMACVMSLSDLQNIKRSGRRLMKLRAGDLLASTCLAVHPDLAIFSKSGENLVIKLKELPESSAPVVGVVAMQLKSDDRVLKVLAVKSGQKLELSDGAKRKLEIVWSDLNHGRRALRGKRLAIKGELTAVEVK
jgi:DNA gyrase subunit A